jgi:NAD(P)-dependent dehydrogenase (short-subunit alcohol dehydrogenase family)
MVGRFQGKVALVTGGSSGIGKATALAFAREDAKVIVADKNVKGGEETVQIIKQAGGEAAFVKTDVSKATEVEALVNKTIELYGHLDCAFNNAGIGGSEVYITDCTEEDWNHTINVNLKGVWLCLKYEIPWMIEHGGGAIVNMSSVAGLTGSLYISDYVASKWGINGLTKSAALEYAKAGIRVNAVCPGMIDTPMAKPKKDKGGFFSWDERAKQEVPLGRRGTPEEVAEAVLWLCSDAASYVTGIAMPVDGGILAQSTKKASAE